MALKTFKDVEEFLDSFSYIDKSNPPGLIRKSRLERMVGLLNWIGNPQESFKSIHLAGSKGKGSTATFISTLSPRTDVCSSSIGVITDAILFNVLVASSLPPQPVSITQ